MNSFRVEGLGFWDVLHLHRTAEPQWEQKVVVVGVSEDWVCHLQACGATESTK